MPMSRLDGWSAAGGKGELHSFNTCTISCFDSFISKLEIQRAYSLSFWHFVTDQLSCTRALPRVLVVHLLLLPSLKLPNVILSRGCCFEEKLHSVFFSSRYLYYLLPTARFLDHVAFGVK